MCELYREDLVVGENGKSFTDDAGVELLGVLPPTERGAESCNRLPVPLGVEAWEEDELDAPVAGLPTPGVEPARGGPREGWLGAGGYTLRSVYWDTANWAPESRAAWMTGRGVIYNTWGR